MKSRKGISPLIAWVLLIGLSVSIGFLVINWTMEAIPEPKPDFSFCDDISLLLVDYTINDNEVLFEIINNGLFSVNKWSFGVTKSYAGVEGQWCEEISIPYHLVPGEDDILEFNMGIYSNPSCSSYDSDIDGDGEIDITLPEEIVLVPWIMPMGQQDSSEEDPYINCNDKKITINL